MRVYISVCVFNATVIDDAVTTTDGDTGRRDDALTTTEGDTGRSDDAVVTITEGDSDRRNAVKEEEGDADRREDAFTTIKGDTDRCNMRFILNCCALQLFT
jgi:hypothetical protein